MVREYDEFRNLRESEIINNSLRVLFYFIIVYFSYILGNSCIFI